MGLHEFDKEVEERRLANARKLEELGLGTAVIVQLRNAAAVKAAACGPPPRPRRCRGEDAEKPHGLIAPRRSTRDRALVTYNEDAAFQGLMMGGKRRSGAGGGSAAPAAKRLQLEDLTEVEVEALKKQMAARRRSAPSRKGGAQGADDAEGRRRGPRDSGKGRRQVHGVWYDSSSGVTCHWCRQKTESLKVTCTHPSCGGGRRMPISFCSACLRRRHGEDAEAVIASGMWVCPPCRGSCGRGCVVCCNCGPCRKKAGLAPTNQIASCARAGGYTNAHDWLVAQVTGETQDQMTKRKLSMPWSGFMKQQQQQWQQDAMVEQDADVSMEMGTPAADATASMTTNNLQEEMQDKEEGEEEQQQQYPEAGGKDIKGRERSRKRHGQGDLPGPGPLPGTVSTGTAAATQQQTNAARQRKGARRNEAAAAAAPEAEEGPEIEVAAGRGRGGRRGRGPTATAAANEKVQVAAAALELESDDKASEEGELDGGGLAAVAEDGGGARVRHGKRAPGAAAFTPAGTKRREPAGAAAAPTRPTKRRAVNDAADGTVSRGGNGSAATGKSAGAKRRK